MKIGIFTRGKHSHSYKWESAFKDGLLKHGIEARWQTWGDKPRDINLAVIWSAHNNTLIEHCKRFDIDYLILERGYFGDRTEWTSCGFNGLNGHADFVDSYADDERMANIIDFIKPPRKSKGSYILIMGQCQGDASVKHIGFNNWLQETYNQLQEITDKKIYYRPHPLQANPFIPDGLEVIKGELHDVIKKAACVVTLNSNSGVDAILAGVPTIAMDKGSMVWTVTSDNLESVNKPYILERERWARELTYSQWTHDEINKGVAWEHLRRRFEDA